MKYFRIGFGRRLSMIGESLGLDFLIYNPLTFYLFHEIALDDAPAIAETFRKIFPKAERLADVGAGSCAYAAEFARRGHSVEAFEKSPFGRRWARKQGVSCRPFNLDSALPAEACGAFDLAYCFEVAEHLDERLGHRLVEFLSSIAPIVVFTAAQPGQGGIGHIFLQNKNYWAAQFSRFHMSYDIGMSEAVAAQFRANGVKALWLIHNCMVFFRTKDHEGS